MPDPEEKFPPPPEPNTSEMPYYEAALKQANEPGWAGNTMAAPPVMDHRLTVTEQLAMRKRHLEHELAQVNAAIDQALQNQPTMKLLDSIAKVGLR